MRIFNYINQKRIIICLGKRVSCYESLVSLNRLTLQTRMTIVWQILKVSYSRDIVQKS